MRDRDQEQSNLSLHCLSRPLRTPTLLQMEVSIKMDTVKSGWSIVFIEGSQFIYFKICLFGLKFYIPVNSDGHVETVS